MTTDIERDAYLLAGPTASGKSAIAAELAREMGAWILSADSMLVYRGMDIGTAKPPLAEREEFHMGGVDLVTPADEFSSGAWLRSAAEWLSSVPPDRPVIVVGGTGLYFSALLRGIMYPASLLKPFTIRNKPVRVMGESSTTLTLYSLPP